MHIVIDGYNLIRQSTYFSALDREDLQTGREALVEALAAYKKLKACTITIVFDGGSAPLEMPRRDRLKGIELRYSQPGELADAVIKRIAAIEREKLVVVSSDHEVTDYAAARGASTISAPEFEERMQTARWMALKGPVEDEVSAGWRPTTKKSGPGKRLPKRQRRMSHRISKL